MKENASEVQHCYRMALLGRRFDVRVIIPLSGKYYVDRGAELFLPYCCAVLLARAASSSWIAVAIASVCLNNGIAKAQSKDQRVIDSSDDTDNTIVPHLPHTSAVSGEGFRHLVASAHR